MLTIVVTGGSIRIAFSQQPFGQDQRPCGLPNCARNAIGATVLLTPGFYIGAGLRKIPRARTALAITAIGNWILGEAELRLLPLLCDKNRTALDVGANFGVYTYYLSRFSLNCIAFEPNPKCALFLRRARLHKVTIEEVALSSSEETKELLVPKAGRWHVSVAAGGHIARDRQTTSREGSDSYLVTSARLDEYGFSRVGMIKIDTEGHETEVILGGIETIRRSRPRILVECEERHRPNALLNVLSLLSNEGYEGCCLMSGQLKKFNSQDQGYAMSSSGNFIFVHSSDPDAGMLLR